MRCAISSLPAVTLSLGGLATIMRFTRAGVLDTLQKDFVIYERAQGFPPRALIWNFVLRNSVVAAVTQIGLLFGGTIAGAVVVETIFDWPGIGFYTVQAILTADYKVMLAVTLLIGVVYALVNILVDVVHGLIDPRLREAGLSLMLVLAKFAKDKPAVLGAGIVVLRSRSWQSSRLCWHPIPAT